MSVFWEGFIVGMGVMTLISNLFIEKLRRKIKKLEGSG